VGCGGSPFRRAFTNAGATIQTRHLTGSIEVMQQQLLRKLDFKTL
jgi:hypothetical protein